ncbi:MAG: diguanylate cyclase [Armatimonadetes bacterium]|nr:diguanylate cyclase [Armatimonadota bacterium]
MRILVAEDDNISRILLTRCLEQLGHQCRVATDGAEAWLLLQDSEFDVLVTDWMMPELDGIELVRRLRSLEQTHYTYVVLLTALSKKEDYVAGMESGADDYLTKPLDRDALKAKLIAAERIVSLHRRMREQTAELERLNRILYETGRVDRLTGVSNRLRMEEDLASIHSRIVRYGHTYCLALVDIDFFKKYNDTYGHGEGDNCLRAVAQCLRGQARTGDEVYRYGGEEFLLVFPEQTADRGAIAMERIRAAVEAMLIPHEGRGPGEVVTISGGVTVMSPANDRSVQQVLDDADKALYQAKKQGRNRIVFYDLGTVTSEAT